MDFNTFCQSITARLTEAFPEGSVISITKQLKNNGILKDMLVIHEPDVNISPSINLTDLYTYLENGTDFDEIYDNILEVYNSHKFTSSINAESFTDFKQASDNIVYRLINKEKNAELLSSIPHIEYLDLAIVFYYIFHSQYGLENGQILISNSHMENWKVDINALHKLAIRNTPALLPAVINSIPDILGMYMDEDIPDEMFDDVPKIYTLSNKEYLNGAICILYPELLHNISLLLSDNLYVIPSSTHECILIPEGFCFDPIDIQAMIPEVNQNHVPDSEILSDRLYYYDRKDDTVRFYEPTKTK